jgi:hypothetical protein
MKVIWNPEKEAGTLLFTGRQMFFRWQTKTEENAESRETVTEDG